MLLRGLELVDILMRIPALLIAVTVHEYAHARMAYRFGDHTARAMGRMTLNPISHLDPIGTLMILIAGFGWAKPVPVNPYNFRSYRSGMLWVSFAGPMANFIAAFVTMFLLYLALWFGMRDLLVREMLLTILQINIFLGLFNLIPVPPLDGSKIFAAVAPRSLQGFFHQIEAYAPILLLVLVFSGALGYIIIPGYIAIFRLFDTIIGFFFGLL